MVFLQGAQRKIPGCPGIWVWQAGQCVMGGLAFDGSGFGLEFPLHLPEGFRDGLGGAGGLVVWRRGVLWGAA